MKNTNQVKKVILGAATGLLALLTVVGNQGLAADNPAATAAQTQLAPAAAPATTIDEILVSDEPNKDGYVLKAKNTLPKTANKIYATVQLGSAVSGQKVIATLTFKGNNAQIGPVVATVGTTGDTMEAFAFTNTAMPWPTGKYQVDISVENGANKSTTFTVSD